MQAAASNAKRQRPSQCKTAGIKSTPPMRNENGYAKTIPSKAADAAPPPFRTLVFHVKHPVRIA